SATSGETVWYDGFTIVAGRMNENYQSSSGGSLRDFKTTNYLMSQEEINAERLAETYNTTNNNASLAGETNNASALAVKTVNTVANSSDDIVFVGTKGYASKGAISEITFGTTDYRTHEYRQTTSGTGLTSNRINSLSYSLVRNNLAVATDDAGIFGIMEETPAVITLNSPLGSEEWEGGSSQTISWTTDGVCEYVNLDYSLDGGTNYDHTIVHNLADAGSYIWNPVDEINSNNVQTRIQCLDAGGNVLASDANDQSLIIDSTSPQVTLHAISNPNGDNVIYGRGEATDVGGATSINRVQYRVDENDWQDALISVNSGTTDVEYDFSTAAISSGAHTIYVRAKDSSLPNGNETDQTIAVSRSFNVDELTVSFSKSSFSTDLDLNSSQIFTDSTVVTVTGLGTAYNLGIKANNIPTNQIYPSETLPFYTGNDNWTGNTKGFGWRYENYNHGYYNPFPTDAYEYLASGKANSNGVTHQIDFKAVVDWTVDAGTYNSDVSIIVTPRY
ncbi:MAG TPA: hypothetical protein PLH65_00300, partial [bacterium]|nr:hypothetical protein [bacterium]